ncbi:MAG: Lrp/AsnC family transcriptional regulator [Chloroflexi bacterium]|nr:Lrp/AsnC family transcriptional regulator [Chloroflexota bacterium]
MKEILKILESDAQATPEKIAVMTGIPLKQVKSVIEKAEKDGIIVRRKTVINWEKAGEEQVAALIEVRVVPQRDVGFDSVAQRIYKFPEAHNVYLVSGTYDLSILVLGKTMREVATFVSEKLAPLEFVQGTITHFVLKRYKEDGDILAEHEETNARLPIVP